MTKPPDPPLKVLVVDYHHDSVNLTARILSGVGYVIRTAECCADALDIARAERIDVLISDIGLPDGDGCGLLATINAIYPVRAVAFTGYATASEWERYERAGFSALLLKPSEIDRIVDAVASANWLR